MNTDNIDQFSEENGIEIAVALLKIALELSKGDPASCATNLTMANAVAIGIFARNPDEALEKACAANDTVTRKISRAIHAAWRLYNKEEDAKEEGDNFVN